MSEIKTAFGYTRAFVRLALEKKLLSRHLKELLSNHELLRQVTSHIFGHRYTRCFLKKDPFLFFFIIHSNGEQLA